MRYFLLNNRSSYFDSIALRELKFCFYKPHRSSSKPLSIKTWKKIIILARQFGIWSGIVHSTNGASSVSRVDTWKCKNKGQTRPPGSLQKVRTTSDINRFLLTLLWPTRLNSFNCGTVKTCRTACCTTASRKMFDIFKSIRNYDKK